MKGYIRSVLWRADTDRSGPGAVTQGEIERIKNPLRDRKDFEELQEICLEVSCCSQEYGFISGFKYGVAFMMECLEWPGQE